MIGNRKVNVIIDTGASASFLPQNGHVLSTISAETKQVKVIAKTANNSSLSLNAKVELLSKPVLATSSTQIASYFVIPNRIDVLGQQAIIGLDICKLFNISVKMIGENMCAFSHNQKIGVEKPISQEAHCNLLASFSAELTDKIHPGSHQDMEQKLIEKMPREIRKLYVEFKDNFEENITSSMQVEPMRIVLSSNRLVKAKLRRNSPEDILEMHNQVTRLIKSDVVEPAYSQYSSNAHLVPKKNGQRRLVINFIPLNSITVKDHYPMPQIQDLFLSLRGARYYCALDCTEGFFQIPIHAADREKTAFITPHGMYQFKKCPFGFTNSPAVFQRAMNSIFADGLFKKCVIYVDDILVFGKSANEVLDNLAWVLSRCRQFNVKLKLSKCQFMQQSVAFLGHQISYNSIAPIPNKTDPMFQSEPQNKTDLLAILGIFNYYSRFIDNYAEKTRILRDLVKKTVTFKWEAKHKQRVHELRSELSKSMPQTIPDSFADKSVLITVGNCSVEVACYSKHEELINRAGHAFASSEMNYTPVEKNMMGIVLAYNKFGPCLKGKVTVKTTCKQLEASLNYKDRGERLDRMLLKLPPDASFDIKTLPSNREMDKISLQENQPDEIFYTDGACTGNGKPYCKASWAVLATMNRQLSQAGLVDHPKPSNQVAELTALLEVCRISKRSNLKDIIVVTDSKYVADFLNKWHLTWISNGWVNNKGKPVTNQLLHQQIVDAKRGLNIKCIHVKGHSDDVNNNIADQMARTELEQSLVAIASIASPIEINQDGDEEIETIKGLFPHNIDMHDKYALIDDKLYYIDYRQPLLKRHRLYVPDTQRHQLLRIAHDDPIYGGHFGVKKTRNKLIDYYWPQMTLSIEEYIASCSLCQRNKNPKGPKYGLLQPIPVSDIFERIHLDIVGPTKESYSENRYIITAIDCLSRFGFARARPEVKTEDIIRFLQEEIFAVHGPPAQITTDNGPQFKSAQFENFVRKLGIKHSNTCTYHPQANGVDERFNGTLVKIIKSYTSSHQQDWDRQIVWALKLYNSTENESTKFKPYTVLYGKEPRNPLNQPRLPCGPQDMDLRVEHEAIRAQVRRNLTEAHRLQKYYYDRKHKPQDFKPFDLVLVRNHSIPIGDSRKLAWLWVGPYMVIKFITHPDSGSDEPRAVQIMDMDKLTKKSVSFCDIKPYKERRSDKEKDPEEDEHLEISGQLGAGAGDLPGAVIREAMLIPSANPSNANLYMQPATNYLNFIRPTRTYGRQNVATNDLQVAQSSPVPFVADTCEPYVNHVQNSPQATVSDTQPHAGGVTRTVQESTQNRESHLSPQAMVSDTCPHAGQVTRTVHESSKNNDSVAHSILSGSQLVGPISSTPRGPNLQPLQLDISLDESSACQGQLQTDRGTSLVDEPNFAEISQAPLETATPEAAGKSPPGENISPEKETPQEPENTQAEPNRNPPEPESRPRRLRQPPKRFSPY